MLERVGEEYQLGLKLFELGNSVARQRELREAALPFMEDLYEATHETIHLGVLDDAEVLYVEKIAGRRGCTVPTTLGTRKPLYCTGLGKAILAYSTPQLVQAVIQNGLPRRTGTRSRTRIGSNLSLRTRLKPGWPTIGKSMSWGSPVSAARC